MTAKKRLHMVISGNLLNLNSSLSSQWPSRHTSEWTSSYSANSKSFYLPPVFLGVIWQALPAWNRVRRVISPWLPSNKTLGFEVNKKSHWGWLDSWETLFPCLLTSVGLPALGRVLVVSIFCHFRLIEATVHLKTLKIDENIWSSWQHTWTLKGSKDLSTVLLRNCALFYSLCFITGTHNEQKKSALTDILHAFFCLISSGRNTFLHLVKAAIILTMWHTAREISELCLNRKNLH